MSKLIEIKQEFLIECDNEVCDFKVQNESDIIDREAGLEYLNKPCPKCGWNLLTIEDYESSRRFLRVINWLNKWFGWLRFFTSKKEKQEISVKVKDGVIIKNKS